MFASVIVDLGSDSWTTASRWVDDLAALEHASHSARLLEPFKALDRSTSSAEQRQMLDELQEVAQTLFNDPASFRDPGFGGGDEKKKCDVPAEPVNPNDLLVHLDELHEGLPHLASAQPGTLSLTGILRLLFETETDEGRTPAAAGDEDIDEGQVSETQPSPKPPDQNDQTVATDGSVIEARFRERLATQINTFMTEMSAAAFAARCSATQMVQAVAFPFPIALRGRRKGWVPDELAERWAIEVFSILFRRQGSGGLLSAVEHRYVENGQRETFDDVVGDGTLWLVLVATLGGTSWRGVGTDIDKAVALREVFSSPQLLASATSGRVTGLLGMIRIEDAKAYVADVAPKVNRLLGEIESALRPVWESEMRDQGARAIAHKHGDLLWRDKVGWAVCLEEVKDRAGQSIKVRLKGVERSVMAGFYVNVSDVCSRDPELDRLIGVLRRSIAIRPI